MVKRITPKQVAEAFARYDIKPTRGTFCSTDGEGDFCGCALTAYAALLGWDVRYADVPVALRDHGLGDAWLDGVVLAFDNDPAEIAEFDFWRDKSKNHPFWRGYRFGKEVARLVFGDEVEEAESDS